MKFKRSYSNARNLWSAYKFAFGGDINHAKQLLHRMKNVLLVFCPEHALSVYIICSSVVH